MIDRRLHSAWLFRLFHQTGRSLSSDAALLSAYARGADQQAFTELVKRHGPMVLGVCERILPDPSDAEDAFQATFLVLAQKAGTLRRQTPLSHWLYTVGYRAAMKARIRSARRRAHEARVAPVANQADAEAESWNELKPILDEELNHLPPKYRTLLVLCYLEGKSHQEAARQLGCPPGSISYRIGRAREMLRERLVRRGVLVSTALLLTFLNARVRAATVPDRLVTATVQAVTSLRHVRHAGASLPASAPSKPVRLARTLLRLGGRVGSFPTAAILPSLALAAIVAVGVVMHARLADTVGRIDLYSLRAALAGRMPAVPVAPRESQ
jgi:RNA polymerase sigma factor (sigma-70 family)